MNRVRHCLMVASATTTLAWLGQAALIRSNYGGNWTALFGIGAGLHPPDRFTEGAWVFPASPGYDGQWYRIVAHDPWLRQSWWRSIDGAEYRYRRILVPAMAWLIAGRPDRIDAAYYGVILFWVFSGTLFTALWLVQRGHPPWWAFLFGLLPGTLISLDRMTVDVAFYACAAAAFWGWRKRLWGLCWVAAALAGLTRDLGATLIAALALAAVLEAARIRAVLFATAIIPGWLWYQHLHSFFAAAHSNAPVIPAWKIHPPLIGVLAAIWKPRRYQLDGAILATTQMLDRFAIAAVLVAAGLAVWLLWVGRREPEDLLASMFVPLFVMVGSPGFFSDPFSYPRAFTPLVALVAWRGLTSGKAWYAIPWAALSLRTIWQFGREILGVAGALLGQG